MGDLTESPTPQQQPNLTPPSRQVPFREDCWTEEATTTLVEAWGRRFLELNRGNLRQKDWQEVADTVNARHGHTKKARRTDVQCKNRIDTLKKKYKTEKAKISESNETLTSSWPFFSRLDFLIGSSYNKNQVKQTPSLAMPLMIMPPPQPVPVSSSAQIHSTMPFSLPSPPMAVPLPYRKPMMPAMMPTMSSAVYNSPMVMPQKRPSPSPGPEESLFRRNYSAVAAAAAAMNYDDEASDDDDEDNAIDDDRVNLSDNDEEDEGVDGEEIGLKRLAKAIESFAETYEKVESMKQRQMIELEKQRMQFAKDLEVQRMQLFMDTQVQLEKMKRVKRSGSSDGNE